MSGDGYPDHVFSYYEDAQVMQRPAEAFGGQKQDQFPPGRMEREVRAVMDRQCVQMACFFRRGQDVLVKEAVDEALFCARTQARVYYDGFGGGDAAGKPDKSMGCIVSAVQR